VIMISRVCVFVYNRMREEHKAVSCEIDSGAMGPL
jgi:hypothetical protein